MNAPAVRFAYALSIAGFVASCGGSGGGDSHADAGDPPDTASCSSDAECGNDRCIDGVCCPGRCSGETTDCMACSRALTGHANGVCAPILANTVCRASIGICDFGERCDGISPVCPGDVVLPAGIPCRTATDDCDAEERCDGVSPVCGTDVLKPAMTPCRNPDGPCDVTDYCSGTSRACPDAFRPDTYICRAASAGICDAPDTCTGYSADCPERFAVNVVCRYPVGSCDVQESCTGAGADCPPDAVIPAGIVCRDSINATCNPVESCDGVSAHCPANVGTCP